MLKTELQRYGIRAMCRLGLLEHILYYQDQIKYSKIKKLKETGELPLPTDLKFEITLKCNLNCIMCHQKDRRIHSKDKLDTKKVKNILKKLKSQGLKSIIFKGGELFVRKDFIEILKYTDDLGYKIRIITNGTLINKKVADELNSLKNLTILTYSIDGLKDTHNKIRQSPNAFDKTIEAIKLTTNKKYLVNINTVIQNSNINEIKEVIKLGRELQVDIMTFIMEMYSTDKEIQETKKITKKDISQFKKEGDYEFNYESIKELKKLFKKEARKSGIYMQLVPSITYTELKNFFNNTLPEKDDYICDTILALNINEKGEVLACPIMAGNKFGDINKKELEKIWNSKEIKKFRKEIFIDKLLPVCSRCCQLSKQNIYKVKNQ